MEIYFEKLFYIIFSAVAPIRTEGRLRIITKILSLAMALFLLFLLNTKLLFIYYVFNILLFKCRKTLISTTIFIGITFLTFSSLSPWNYSEALLITDFLYTKNFPQRTLFLSNRWKDSQILITKPLCSGDFIVDTSL